MNETWVCAFRDSLPRDFWAEPWPVSSQPASTTQGEPASRPTPTQDVQQGFLCEATSRPQILERWGVWGTRLYHSCHSMNVPRNLVPRVSCGGCAGSLRSAHQLKG